MIPDYIAQLFFIDKEQLDKIFKNKLKEKDSQLEIDFEKANKESEFDAELSKMTKKELIEYIKDKNIELDKCNEARKCEIMIKENLRNQLYESENKVNKLFTERNDLLIKLNKANNYIERLKSIIENIKFVMRRDFNIIINI